MDKPSVSDRERLRVTHAISKAIPGQDYHQLEIAGQLEALLDAAGVLAARMQFKTVPGEMVAGAHLLTISHNRFKQAMQHALVKYNSAGPSQDLGSIQEAGLRELAGQERVPTTDTD